MATEAAKSGNGRAIATKLKVGDTVKVEMFDSSGKNIFGTIFQKVAQA